MSAQIVRARGPRSSGLSGGVGVIDGDDAHPQEVGVTFGRNK